MLVHNNSNYLKVVHNKYFISGFNIINSLEWDLTEYESMYLELDLSNFISNEVIDCFVLNFHLKSYSIKDLQNFFSKYNIENLEILFQVLDKPVDTTNDYKKGYLFSYNSTINGRLSITNNSHIDVEIDITKIIRNKLLKGESKFTLQIVSNCYSLNEMYQDSINSIILKISDEKDLFVCTYHYEQNDYKNHEQIKINDNIEHLCDLRKLNDATVINLYTSDSKVFPINLNLCYRQHNLINHIGKFIPSWFSFISKLANEVNFNSPIIITDYLGNKKRYYYFTEEEKDEINYKFSSEDINTDNVKYYYDLSNNSKLRVENYGTYHLVYLMYSKGYTMKFKYYTSNELEYDNKLLMLQEINDNGFIITYTWNNNLLQNIKKGNDKIFTFNYADGLLNSIYLHENKNKIELSYNDTNEEKTLYNITRGYVPNESQSINQNDNIDMSLLILFDYHSYMHNLIISEIKDRILERKFNYFLSVQEYEEDDENVPPTFNKLFKFFEGCNSKFIQFEQYKINIFYDFTEISNKYDQKTIIWYDEFFEKELVEINNKKIFYAYDQITPYLMQPVKISTIIDKKDNLLKNGELNFDEEHIIQNWTNNNVYVEDSDVTDGSVKYDEILSDYPIFFMRKYTELSNSLNKLQLRKLIQNIDIYGYPNDEYQLFVQGRNNNEFISPLKIIISFYYKQEKKDSKEFRLNYIQEFFQIFIKNFITECIYDKIEVSIEYDGYNDAYVSYISLRKIKNGSTESYNIDPINGMKYYNTNNFSILQLDSKNDNEEIYVYNTNIIDKKRYNKSKLISNSYNSIDHTEKKYEYENNNCTKEETKILNEKIFTHNFKYENNLLVEEIDDLGNKVVYTYYSNNRLDMISYYLNLKYKYYYDINNYIVKISKFDNSDDFINECNIEYDGNKQIKSLNEYEYPRFEFKENNNGQLSSINLNLSATVSNNLVKYEYYDNINDCRNDLIKKKILYETDNESEILSYEYDNNNKINKILYNNNEKYNFIYDEYDRLIKAESIDNDITYNNTFEYDDLSKNQLSTISYDNKKISYEYDNNNIQAEILKINDKYHSYYYDYVDELQDYNLLGYLSIINKNTLNDYLLIVSKFNIDNDESLKDEVYLTYGNTTVGGEYSVKYNKNINHNVICLNSNQDYLDIPIGEVNSQRINNTYYNGMLYNEEKFNNNYTNNKIIYLWCKVDANINQKFNLINILCDSTEVITLFLKTDGSLNLYSNGKECSTGLNINFNEWNFIGLNLKNEYAEIYCNENKKIISNAVNDESITNGFKLCTEIVVDDYTNAIIGNKSNGTLVNYQNPVEIIYCCIGCDAFSDIKRSAIYLNGIKYLNNYKVNKFSGVSFFDNSLYSDFEVFPLLGSLTSNKGTKPEICFAMNNSYSSDKAKIFKYDDENKNHVFASYRDDIYQLQGHNQLIGYKIPFNQSGIISLWVKPDEVYINEENRYLFDISGKFRISLSINNYIVIERKIDLPEGSVYSKEKLARRLSSNEWNLIVVKFDDGLDIKVNSSVSIHRDINLNIEDTDILYLGVSLDSNDNPFGFLNGFVKLLTFKIGNSSIYDDDFFNSIYFNGNIININKNYDDYNRVKSVEISEKNTKLVYEYKFYDKENKLNPYVTCENLPNGNKIIYNYNEKKMLTHKLELTSNEDICSVYFYKYNSRNQLVEEYHYGYNNIFEYLYVFEYDNYGNIVFKKEKDVNNNIIHSFEYYYDTNNPYLLIMVKLDNEIIYNIEYHAHKKLYPSKITKNGEEFNLTWEENRLKSFGNCSFYYNYDGTRTRLTNNQYVKDFVSFNNNVYSVIKTEINNPENSVEINYIFDEQSVVRGFKLNNKFYYFERDILGNINKIIDINNIVYVEYKYDSYGKPTIIVPTELSNELKTIAEIISCNNIYLYRGYIYDVETGWFWLSSRYYSPELCRFISPDDIEYLDPESVNGLNLYCYCLNNPISYADPSGHFVITTAALIAGLVAVGKAMLIGAAIGAAVGAGFEFGKQLYQNGGDFSSLDLGAIGMAALGGAVSGAISAIPIPGSGFLSYLGTFAIGGAASIAGGLVTGSVNSWETAALAFGIGGVAGVIGRGASDIVKHIKVSKQIGAISNKAQSIASMSAKNKSLAIWNMVGADNFSRNAFKSWGYNQIFDLLMTEGTNQLLINSTSNLTRYLVYSSLVSSLGSGWF